MSQCEAEGCEDEALFRCFWPGQTLLQCDAHKRNMYRIAEAMGFELEFQYVDQAAYDSVSTGGSHRNVEDE